MEIHSSSLASIPSGYQQKATNKEQDTDKVISPAPQSQLLLKEINKPFDTKSFQQLTTLIENQHTVPTNSRTARALDAYAQESIKPLKIQRSEFISNVDIFA